MISSVRCVSVRPATAARRSSVVVRAAAWKKVSSKADLKGAGGKLVVEVDGERERRIERWWR